ncbi:MAG TPA: 2-C-methyl-D-erythritol 2,4-cyclodiphosphate synthase, partial [Spirochaetales bacterium]|nr:2-C-methyl-D-erythritol 2,4-cyclodiphosphate synthase [Spirochaetales bacterium]
MNRFRIGQGWDRHALVSGRDLVLGGVRLESDLGCLGHSDGDPLTHALTDAVLGAIGQGDIGRHFPPSDDRYKDSASRVFLEYAMGLARAAGWELANADST